jgi:hypothetical protein
MTHAANRNALPEVAAVIHADSMSRWVQLMAKAPRTRAGVA